MSEKLNTDLLRSKLMLYYRKLEDSYKPTGITVGTYNTPVNFKESLSTPVHRWYGYKEGFSPSFINDFISNYKPNNNPIVFDPFCGVGTTGLEAIKMGFDAYLMDVNPLAVFASTVKTSFNYKLIPGINSYLDQLMDIESFDILVDIKNQTIKKYFDPITWDSLLQIKSFISTIGNQDIKNLFSLALLSLIDEISTHHKNGNGVKKKKFLPDPSNFFYLKSVLISRIEMYVKDIRNTKILGNCVVYNKSNIEPYILPRKADIVFTSPPYANCFDYSKVYLTELWVGGFFLCANDQRAFREKSIISHVHYKWKHRNEMNGSDLVNNIIVPILSEQKLWNPNIPSMIKGYFSDLGKFIENLRDNLKDNAIVGIVVGNSVYGGTPIATDILLAEQAEKLGFECLQIKVYRKIIASSQQMVILNDTEKSLIRESLIILKWHKQT